MKIHNYIRDLAGNTSRLDYMARRIATIKNTLTAPPESLKDKPSDYTPTGIVEADLTSVITVQDDCIQSIMADLNAIEDFLLPESDRASTKPDPMAWATKATD